MINFVHVKIHKGIYGLPQAGILANKLLKELNFNHMDTKKNTTHKLWTHTTQEIRFSLVVHDFGIQYVGKEHVYHLIHCLQTTYPIEINWINTIYCDMYIFFVYP